MFEGFWQLDIVGDFSVAYNYNCDFYTRNTAFHNRACLSSRATQAKDKAGLVESQADQGSPFHFLVRTTTEHDSLKCSTAALHEFTAPVD